MSPNAAAIVVLTLLGSFVPSSGFVRTPSTALRTQAPSHSRRLSTPLPCSQEQRPPCFTTRQRTCRASWRAAAGVPSQLSVGGGGIDDIDPLEAGPDAVEPALEYDEEVAAAAAPAPAKKTRARKAAKGAVKEDGADEVAMEGLASAVKQTAAKAKKKKRRRTDPFMPKGSVAPIEWQDYTALEEGCRAHLVVIHTGLPKDQVLATSLVTQVKERFGGLVNVFESFDDDEESTEEERRKSNAFEVWLEGPEIIVYHARGECEVDITEEIISKIVDDIHERIQDEAILGLYCSQVPMFRLAGLTPKEQKSKQFYPL